MPEHIADRELSLKLADEVVRNIRAHGTSAHPRSYELWYTHISGQNAALSRALSETLDHSGSLTDEVTQSLYDRFLASNRFALQAEKAGTGLLMEIESVMEMIDLAMGNTNTYGESLEKISGELTENADRKSIRDIVARLVLATRETVATNQTLEARLRETRSEIQDLRETLESIRTESLTDPLTTLANRKHLDRTLLQAVDHAAISGEPLTVLMIDVDKFKDFNDTWGHLTGDQVLRLVAMSIKGAVRPTDTAARFGGEEFAIILPQSTLKSGLLVAERIRQTVMSRELVKRSTGEALGRLTVSIGLAAFAKGDTAAMLLERADKCLLEAKRAGRNRCLTEADLQHSYPDVA
ncbi:MAG: GGDEF domain-containing protein [Alsobacter sp.]